MFDSFEFLIGALFGMLMGVSFGISIGKSQKPWSDLTELEKRAKKLLLVVAGALVVAGLIVLFLFSRLAEAIGQ